MNQHQFLVCRSFTAINILFIWNVIESVGIIMSFPHENKQILLKKENNFLNPDVGCVYQQCKLVALWTNNSKSIFEIQWIICHSSMKLHLLCKKLIIYIILDEMILRKNYWYSYVSRQMLAWISNLLFLKFYHSAKNWCTVACTNTHSKSGFFGHKNRCKVIPF